MPTDSVDTRRRTSEALDEITRLGQELQPDHYAPSDWRVIAEWDWVIVASGDLLHAVKTVTNDADEDWIGLGETECGWVADCDRNAMSIPGLISRMGAADRCVECCAATGMPPGAGSPKNDDACETVLTARLAALEQDPQTTTGEKEQPHG